MTAKLKENLIAFFVAILLTGWVILAINSSSNLATDILWTKKNVTANADMRAVYTWNQLVLIADKNIDNVASISLELLFNKDKVSLKQDSLDSDYNISTSEKEGWNGYTVIIQNIGQVKKWYKLLEISNITKEQYDNINIGHIQVISNNWNIVNLTVSK